MKNLPLGIQTFKRIIEENYLYVDKTKDIYNLLDNGIFYFLSRPRRFGKSLLVTTLKEIFSGNKELFKGLWIYDKIEFKKHPIIHLDFSDMSLNNTNTLIQSLELSFRRLALENNIELTESFDYKSMFKELILKLSTVDKVVILIDEYDKPIIEHVDSPEIATEMRNLLKELYSTIKSSEAHIRFAFLTGITKFSKVSIFSGLNNLRDITLEEKFSTITGYTEKELFFYFIDYISSTSNKLKVSDNELKSALKSWYNGYSWDGVNFVYNPYSILSIFTSQQINNYWFSSGTPTFLLKMIKEYDVDIKKLENYETGSDIFESYDIERMNVESLLFQTGYLTIKKVEQLSITDRYYVLSYPNLEVKDSLLRNILTDISGHRSDTEIIIKKLIKNIKRNYLEEFFKELRSLFSSIPSHIFIKDKEAYYHTIIYLVLTLMGVRISVEVHTNKGRIDAVIHNDNYIYILEFKLGEATKALNQIENIKYHEKYLSTGKIITLVGIGFDTEERNIKDYLVKIL